MKKVLKFLLASTLLIAAFWYFKSHQPGANGVFLPCPVKLFTGFDCPGCGSQRAVHYLTNFEFSEAFSMNPLLVCALPYVLFGFAYKRIGLSEEVVYKIRRYGYGGPVVYLWFVVIIAFTIWRNWS